MAKPRRTPPRTPTNARLDLPIVRVLEAQAEEAGMALLTYIEVVLATAHGYSGRHLPVMESVPRTPITAEQLRDRTRGLTAADCVDVSRENKMQPLKIEEPLLDEIKARSRELGGVAYSAYIRAILRVATGGRLPGRGDQPFLGDAPVSHQGGTALRRVS